MEASPKLFDAKINHALLHQVVVSEEANARVVHASAKGRGEVRGGGRKPWRQKGTGRARHGSIRSPLWKGGGATHGPMKERVFAKKINKKMKSQALAMAFSAKAKDNEIVLLDSVDINSGKTKDAARILHKLSARKPLAAINKKSALVILPTDSANEQRAFRNIAKIEVVSPSGVTARRILANAFVVMSKDVIAVMEKRAK